MLFGYEQRRLHRRARNAHAGKFEQAQGGTLLLDEITEMPLQLQAKLLRVLQEREVERIGGSEPDGARRARDRHHQPPAARRSGGRPLPRRPLLPTQRISPGARAAARAPRRHPAAGHAPAAAARARPAQRIPALSADAAHLLLTYTWPGNVRELDNLLQRALVLVEGSVIEAEHILFEKQPTRLDASATGARRHCTRPLRARRARRDPRGAARRARQPPRSGGEAGHQPAHPALQAGAHPQRRHRCSCRLN